MGAAAQTPPLTPFTWNRIAIWATFVRLAMVVGLAIDLSLTFQKRQESKT